MRPVISIFIYLIPLLFNTVCGSDLAFPPLSSIVAESHLHDLSDSEISEHVRHLQQYSNQDLGKPVQSQYSPHDEAEEMTDRNLCVFCTALKGDARENNLVQKKKSVEEGLGLPLALMNVDKSFACYSGTLEREMFNNENTKEILHENQMVAQMLPNELKINRNVLQFIDKMRNGSRDDMVNTQLLIHLYKNSTNIDDITDEYARTFLNETASSSIAYKRDNFGIFMKSWRNLLSTAEERCKEMPFMGGNFMTNRHTIKIIILDIFTPDYPVSCFVRFVRALADRSVVGRLAIGYRPVAFNYESRGVTQSGTIFEEPFSEAGLDGSNQIVGVADTGLYDLSCFFYDDSPTPGDVTSRVQLTSSSVNSGQLTIESNRRKVVQYNYNVYTDKVDDQGGHGTHVAGSIVGSCPSNPKMNGMAPGSKVSFFDIGETGSSFLMTTPSDYAIYHSAYLAGARVHSNSWGSSCAVDDQPCDLEYDDSCEEADQFMWDHPDMLLLFAAGNDGEYGKKSIGSPALAKSPITVGATITRIFSSNEFISQTAMASFSSIGPTKDGRYGIDISAPGDYIMSAYSGDPNILTAAINSGTGEMQARSALPMSGTSMATPIVAGNALLVRQFFMDSNFWAKVCNSADAQCGALSAPSASLIKAVLLNSGSAVARYGIPHDGGEEGTQLLGDPPDVFQGFGQVTLKNVFTLDDGSGMNVDKSLYIYDDLSLSSGDIEKFVVTVSSDNADKGLDLKVTISWTDKPYDVSASGANILLNDIDLLVESPQGDAYWGNRQLGGDNKNTVEQVHITSADEVGDYIIYIKANTLVTATQKVALVLTYPCDAYPNNKGNVYVAGPTSVSDLPSGLTQITSSPTNAPSTVPPLPSTTPTADIPSVVEYTLNAPVGATIGPNFEDTGLVFIGNISAQGLLKSIKFDLSVSGQSSWSIYSLFSSILITAPTGERVWVGGYFRDYYASDNLYITSTWPYNSDDFQYLPFTKDLSGAEIESSSIGDWQIHLAFGYNWRPEDIYNTESKGLVGSVSLKIDTAGTTPHPTCLPTYQPTSPTPQPTIQPTAAPFTEPSMAPIVTAYPTSEVKTVAFQMSGLSKDEIESDVVLRYAFRVSISRALQVNIVYVAEIEVIDASATSRVFRKKLESDIVEISSRVSSSFTTSTSTASSIQYEFRSEVQNIQPWRDTNAFNVSNFVGPEASDYPIEDNPGILDDWRLLVGIGVIIVMIAVFLGWYYCYKFIRQRNTPQNVDMGAIIPTDVTGTASSVQHPTRGALPYNAVSRQHVIPGRVVEVIDVDDTHQDHPDGE